MTLFNMLKNAIWLFGFATLLLILFLPSFTKMSDLQQKNDEYDRQIIQLKDKGVDLREENHLLENDPIYLEKVAREKMGLVREGEVVYKLTPANAVETKPKSTGTTVPKSTATTQKKR